MHGVCTAHAQFGYLCLNTWKLPPGQKPWEAGKIQDAKGAGEKRFGSESKQKRHRVWARFGQNPLKPESCKCLTVLFLFHSKQQLFLTKVPRFQRAPCGKKYLINTKFTGAGLPTGSEGLGQSCTTTHETSQLQDSFPAAQGLVWLVPLGKEKISNGPSGCCVINGHCWKCNYCLYLGSRLKGEGRKGFFLQAPQKKKVLSSNGGFQKAGRVGVTVRARKSISRVRGQNP